MLYTILLSTLLLHCSSWINSGIRFSSRFSIVREIESLHNMVSSNNHSFTILGFFLVLVILVLAVLILIVLVLVFAHQVTENRQTRRLGQAGDTTGVGESFKGSTALELTGSVLVGLCVCVCLIDTIISI
ncbi:hypothetical protein ASPWEDRAFT_657101 [Aspergillus wentii DTO 134E9]|uniref:Uncharacterized protein n=1 Tax=Aspergillus wentii DTO 134E9 TaxID=1073089 RepID=A0A1L9RBJ4_ASPWE|nr:uncharacterized protein ASPWEDRAFT_657101 [Aspergillus wentii DTO 134E9]OJJ32295.1 hypothetical protein ASPWEDRAFT_657101 [Aspergillus wentii DTO 134E9]